LPASGPFSLTVRVFSPKELMLDDTWKPPAVKLAQ